ncbi:MAG TPA: PQQ-binding-like beta-propeller repeat protein [Candidatus Sulfotelmatobacter sp.]|nr:PQQ-binding-like beta-propeller repeat protein [Candidatus Sulfotelmatobacter sp.]
MNLTRKAVTAVILVLLMASITLAMSAQAQSFLPAGVVPTNLQEGGTVPGPVPAGVTPNLMVKTHAFLSFRPNPVGVGQTFLVNMWLNPATHASRYLSDYKVTITKPDGKQDVITMDSYQADTTAWFEYIADQLGTWKLKFEFPGGYYPSGNYTADPGAVMGSGYVSFPQSCYYEPSSTAEQTLTVQQDVIYPWPESPLPTDYWTRPVRFENREWWPILGNYPGTGWSGGWKGIGDVWNRLYPNTNPNWGPRYNFHPWVSGPNTVHVVWKRQGAVAGLIGGPSGPYGATGNPGSPSLVYAGRCYQTITKPGVGSVAQCYDLRTGEIYYEIPTASGGVTPSIIAYTKTGMLEVPGAEAGARLNAELISISGGQLMKVNPWTGALSVNVSISPLTGGGGTFVNQIEGYALAIQDLGSSAGANRYRLINWTTAGSTSNFTARIISNTTYAMSSLPSLYDLESGYGASVSSVTPPAMGAWYGTTVLGYNLKTGQLLWNKTVEDTCYSMMVSVADHGKVAALMMGGYFMAWDLATGNLAWKGEAMDYPWSEPAFGAYSIQSAYGMLFRQAYDGVYAFDWNDGHIVWHYKAVALSMYESPYTDANGTTVYSFNTGATIADGKMWTYNTEHTESWPLTRGWGIHCINVTTGELIWKIGNPMSPGAVADGYLTAADSRDGYMYVFGKGKSATTIAAPDIVVSKGTGVVIKGTVLDISPAQPNIPCVSKDSMQRQMEYLHLQYPIDGIWHNETITGVPVSLTAIAADGAVVDLGTVTTDGYYGTFEKAWTPPNEGTYKIIASFAGDDAYGSSSAATAISVGPAPVTPDTENQQQQITVPDYTMTLMVGFIAVIIAVAIATVLILRKK